MDACHTYHMTILGLYSKIKSSPKIFNMLFTKYPALKITKLFCHPPLKMCSWVQEFFRVRWIQFPSLFSQVSLFILMVQLMSEKHSIRWDTCPTSAGLNCTLLVNKSSVNASPDQNCPFQSEEKCLIKQTPRKRSNDDCGSNYLYLSNLAKKPKVAQPNESVWSAVYKYRVLYL